MRRALFLLVGIYAVAGCFPRRFDQRTLHRPGEPLPAGVIKAHLLSGELVVLADWSETDTTLSGQGTLYDLDRTRVRSGAFTLPVDSIALLETSVRRTSRPAGPSIMATFSVLWGLTTLACVADPKSCFGSCPTFYVAGDTGEVLAAEGFSSSIARVLEQRDLDQLYPARQTGDWFTLYMRNEALETHAVRRLRLYAVPRPAGGRVFASPDDQFFPATAITGLAACSATEGDCRPALLAVDGVERTSAADSTNLAALETVELEFPAATGRLGLVLGVRQSLLTTFVFYQTMAYLGSTMGETLARLERMSRDEAAGALNMGGLLGRIEITLWENGAWRPIGTHDEAGPLASQFAVFPFTRGDDPAPVRLRFRMAKGDWRLGYAALARIGEPVTPVAIAPEAVRRGGRLDGDALAILLDSARHLVTYPGDEYEVTFRLPNTNGDLEFFLESEGYYYEWMRQEWLAEENPALAAFVLANPAEALRFLAPEYKRVEPKMERLFWSSRFRR